VDFFPLRFSTLARLTSHDADAVGIAVRLISTLASFVEMTDERERVVFSCNSISPATHETAAAASEREPRQRRPSFAASQKAAIIVIQRRRSHSWRKRNERESQSDRNEGDPSESEKKGALRDGSKGANGNSSLRESECLAILSQPAYLLVLFSRQSEETNEV